MLYRFKIYWEENADVERIILIKSNQTFKDFFNILTESFELNNKDISASFFTSDDYWDKHIEITLKAEDIQGDEKLMDKTAIASLIEQPKQKFVFVYDNQLQLTFHIELIRIEKENLNSDSLPKVISSKNKIPKSRKTVRKNKTGLSADVSDTAAPVSDEELDKLIYTRLMNKSISEEDILNGNLDALFGNTNKLADNNLNDDADNEEPEEFFDEEDDVFDDDDFNNDGYFDIDENDEK